MAGSTPPARLNRTLLFLVGAVLLAAGAFGAAFGAGQLRGVLPGLDPAVPLLPEQLAPPVWTAYAVTAAAVLVGLLCLGWLLAQTRRRPTAGTWRLAAGETTITVDADDVAAAVARDVEGYEHVSRASVALVGDHRSPTVHLDVTVGPTADLAALRTRIAEHALPRLRTSLGSDDTRTDLVLRTARTDPGRRVS